MKHSLYCKIISILVFAAAWGFYVNYDYRKWNMLGKDMFLQYQSHRFDAHIDQPSIWFEVGMALGIIVVFVLYELLVAALKKLISKIN